MPDDEVREVRLLLAAEDGPRRLCKVFVTDKDESVYLAVTADLGTYRYGVRLTTHPGDHTVPLLQLPGPFTQPPTISIHATGEIHAKSPNSKTVRLWGVPLAAYRGQRIAQLTVDHFDALPPYPHERRYDGPERDLIVVPRPHSESGEVTLFANGAEPLFDDKCQGYFTLWRPLLRGPLFVGFRLNDREPLSPAGAALAGVTVIAGFRPDLAGRPAFVIIVRRGAGTLESHPIRTARA